MRAASTCSHSFNGSYTTVKQPTCTAKVKGRPLYKVWSSCFHISIKNWAIPMIRGQQPKQLHVPSMVVGREHALGVKMSDPKISKLGHNLMVHIRQ